MAGADKRAKLLSDLLAAKGGASGDAGPGAEAERASVIQIAKRRIGEDRAGEAPAAPSVLYSKGAATASTFRPSYWSFDHEQQAERSAAPVKVEPPLPPAPAIPVAPARTAKPLPVNFVVGFGCLALVVSTTLFVLSLWHRAEPPAVQPEPASIAAAPASTLPVVPLPPQAPAESVAVAPAQPPAPIAPAPAPVVAAPAPAALASPAPVPAPTPVASEPPPPPAPAVKIVETQVEPASVAASSPASSPSFPADTQQADALLARGDELLSTGDVAAARLFYQRASEQGSAAAATAVGQTYDPAVLELLRVRGVRGDAQLAAEWYRKAIAAGDRQAEVRLKRLLARSPG